MSSSNSQSNLDAVLWPIGFVLDDRYVIEAHLSTGGFGIVYRARDTRLDRPVAIKLLQEAFAEHESVRPRFEREARTLATLSHPHIVGIQDYGLFDNRPYLVMELLQGQTLRAKIDQGPLAEEDAFDIMRQLLTALAYAHDKGMVHRDLKPGNIFLLSLPAASHYVKILDFGLVKFVAGEESQQAALTRAGVVFGTPAYMPPEQVLGDVTDATTDVYAAGVLLYEMLTGAKPFKGDVRQVLEQHSRSPVPPFEQHGDRIASPELVALLKRAMAKRKQDRFATCGEFLEALDALARPAVRSRAPAAHAATAIASPRTALRAFEDSGEPAVAPAPEDSEELAATQLYEPPATAAAPAGTSAQDGPAIAPAGTAQPRPQAASPDRQRPSAGPGMRARAALQQLARELRPRMRAGLERGSGALRRVRVAARPLGTRLRRETERRIGQFRALPARGRALILGAPGLALVLLLASSLWPEPAPQKRDTPEATSGAEPSSEGPTAKKGADPWKRQPPPVLDEMREALVAGRLPGKQADRRLRSYAYRHRDDPRPELLLAEIYHRRHWHSDALKRYRRAYAIDPGARHDPRMLRNLVELLQVDSVSGQARRMLLTMYGHEALPALDEALDGSDIKPADARRLEGLRDAIASRD